MSGRLTLRPRRVAAFAQWSTVVLGLGALLTLSICTFFIPFTGDQALFAVVSEQLLDGYVLYRDFWDIKQPGIFWWYALADLLPGSHVFGVRLLEWLWQAAAVALVIQVTRNVIHRPWLQWLAPVLALGPYLVTGGLTGWGLALVEPLMGLPILGIIVCLQKARLSRRPHRLWVAAGVCVGIAIVLKALYVLVAAPVVVATLWALRCRQPAAAGASTRVTATLAWVVVGSVVPLATVIAYAAATESLGLLLSTTFIQPLDIRQLPSLSSADGLLELGRLALFTYGWALILIGLSLLPVRGRARSWLTFPLLVWAGTAAVIASAQAPNTYQIYAVLFPVGLLAALAIDQLLDWAVISGRAVARVVVPLALAASCVAAVPVLRSRIDIPVDIATALASPGQFQHEPLRRAINAEYAQVSLSAALIPGSVSGGDQPVYVFGSPLWYWVLQKRQAVEIHGWSPQYLTADLWAELERELRRSKPRALFVDEFSRPYLAQHAPGIRDLLEADYEQAWARSSGPEYDAGAGTWWITTLPGRPAPSPEGVRLGS